MHTVKNKENKNPIPLRNVQIPGWMLAVLCVAGAVTGIIVLTLGIFETKYKNRIYPHVKVGGVSVGGKTKEEVAAYWKAKNVPFGTASFELRFQSTVATISGSDIDLGYDADLSATQAYLVGRSSGFISNIFIKFFQRQVNLEPYFRWKENNINDILANLSAQINIPSEDALFHFAGNKVTSFRPSKEGRQINLYEARMRLKNAFLTVAQTNQQHVTVLLPVETVKPLITTDGTNTYGIRELVGRGYSQFSGSIPGRIHNVALAASRMNGVLIKPGETFSFNTILGDISAATGYQSAYIIKDGRTVLGDGGGVCQVSSTLFRAALNAGLPVLERHAHAYRVHYYEDGGFKPGLDATVFSPSVDLKIKNDTATHILIQARTDTKNLTLTFELYGSKDGRVAQILDHKVWDQSPPPPPLYQDDPTLPNGAVKQVDWEAWGAKTSFRYKVVRSGDVLQDTVFYSSFRPWQSVYLRGPQ